MGKPRANITDNIFKTVKIMVDGGTSAEDVAELLQIGVATVYRIKKAESLDEYKQIISSYNAKGRQGGCVQTVETKQIVNVPWAMVQEMHKTNELLALISNKLAFIVEQLS